jgi:hypothetical protein
MEQVHFRISKKFENLDGEQSETSKAQDEQILNKFAS